MRKSIKAYLLLAGCLIITPWQGHAATPTGTKTPTPVPYYGTPSCPGSTSGPTCSSGATVTLKSSDSYTPIPCNCPSGWKQTATYTQNGVTTVECQCGSWQAPPPYNPPTSSTPTPAPAPKACCGSKTSGNACCSTSSGGYTSFCADLTGGGMQTCGAAGCHWLSCP